MIINLDLNKYYKNNPKKNTECQLQIEKQIDTLILNQKNQSKKQLQIKYKLSNNSDWKFLQALKIKYDKQQNFPVVLQLNLEDLKNDWLFKYLSEDLVAIEISAKQIYELKKTGMNFIDVYNNNFEILNKIFRQDIPVIIDTTELLDNNEIYKEILLEIKSIHEQLFQNNTKLQNSVKSCYDFPLSPLQPLGYNLESTIYETFELDKKKYDLYECSIFKAFVNKKSEIKNVLQAGAGRGQILTRIISVLKNQQFNEFKNSVLITILEKNANCIPGLLFLKENLGFSNIIIINQTTFDFEKSYKGNEKFDLIISEMLGSFGDNELSPECLKPLEKLLSKNGVFIPQKYESCISLVSCQKCFNQLENRQKAYTVFLARYNFISDEYKTCFNWNHPETLQNFNEKKQILKFTAKTSIITLFHEKNFTL